MKSKIYLSFTTLLLICSCGKKMEEVKPIRKDVIETVFASGKLKAAGEYHLTAQTDGYLLKVEFNEGDIVGHGQTLAVIENRQNNFNEQSTSELYDIAIKNISPKAPSLVQAKNSISIARQKMHTDSITFSKYRELSASNSISKSDFDNMSIQYQTSKVNYLNALENYNVLKQQADQSYITSSAQKNINRIVSSMNEIRAVGSGKIYKKFKQRGDYVRKGDVIATIGDMNNIYAEVGVDEGNIDKVKIGQEAIVKLNVNSSKTYKGTVSEIYPSFEESTQSFTCKIMFKKPLEFTVVNTQLQSNIIVDQTKNALLIPSNYIDFGGRVELKGKKEKVKVVTKFVSNEWTQVVSGIDENTILVTENIKENNQSTSEVGAQLNR